jgi:hypothetical protein
MNLEGQSETQENTPRPFKEIPGLWIQLGQMTESFFTKELPRVSVSNTIYGVLIYAGASTLISVVQSLLGGIINFVTKPAGTQQSALLTIIGTTTIFICCFGLFVTPISFYLNNGISYVSALIFGGKGKFSSQAYLSSLFFVPLGLISSLVSLISLVPTVGIYIFSIALIGIAIIHIIFTIRSFKVVHSLTTGRAVAAVLSPIILILVPLCMIIVLTLMGPLVRNVFSTINSGLGTPAP